MCLEEGVSAHATWAQSLRPEGHSKVLGLYHSITEQSHGGSCPAEWGAVQQGADPRWELSNRAQAIGEMQHGWGHFLGQRARERKALFAVFPPSSPTNPFHWPDLVRSQLPRRPEEHICRRRARMDLWASGTWLGTLRWQLCRGWVGWC